jgi:VWFA-related protein
LLYHRIVPRRGISLIYSGVVFFCLLPAAQPQQATATSAANSSRRITLDVVVTEKSGKPVGGLTQSDFTLFDNKQQQKIVSFQAVEGPTADPPPEVILLIDEVNTSFQNVAHIRDQVKRFLGQNGGQLAQPVSVIFFADSGTNMQNASRDGNALAAAIDQSNTALRTSRPSQGIYGAAERIQMSLRALNSIAAYEAMRPGKKMLVWMSPGWAFLSGPAIQFTAKDRQTFFNTIVGVSNALLRARITLYSIDPLGASEAGGIRTSYYQEFLKPVPSASQAESGDLALQVLAQQSGGRVFSSNNDLTRLIASCAADAEAWYVLSFDAPPADGPNEFHALSIKIDKPGLTARTRIGYYDQP